MKKEEESLISLSDEHVKDIWRKYYKTSDYERMVKERLWTRNWDLINNNFPDDEKKEKWQSLIWSPDFPKILESIAKKLIQAAKRSDKFFDIETPKNVSFSVPLSKEELKRVTNVLFDAVYYYLVDVNKFFTKFEDGIKSGLLSRIIFKMGWKEEDIDEPSWSNGKQVWKKVKSSYLSLHGIDPYRYWNDFSGLNRFKIHEYKITYTDLLAVAKNPDNKYDLKAVKSLKNTGFSSKRTSAEKSREQQAFKQEGEENIIYVQECYGEIPSEDNDKVYKKLTWSIANENVLIRFPLKVDSWISDDGFIESEIIRKPFQIVHSNPMENISSLAEFRTMLLRLMADSALMSAIFAYEIDLSSIIDPNQFDDGFYPGMHYFVDRKEGQHDVVRNIKLAQTTQDTFSAFNVAGEIMQESTKIDPWTTSEGNLPSRTPARTFLAKNREGGAFHNGISETLEDSLIVPIVQKAIELIIQYQNWTSDEIRSVCGDDVDLLAGLSQEDKFNLLKLGFKAKARGMSIELSRQEEIEKIVTYFELIGKLTQAQPMLSAHGYDFNAVIDDITELFGFKHLDFIKLFNEYKQKVMENKINPQTSAIVNPGSLNVPSNPPAIPERIIS